MNASEFPESNDHVGVLRSDLHLNQNISASFRNCGEMSSKSPLPDDAPKADVCGSGAKIIYAWAMDAPDLHLPKGKTLMNLNCISFSDVF